MEQTLRMATNTIDRDSPIPVYFQIALDLQQRISNREWQANNQLPSEPELASQYQVSRMTVRQAIAELVKDGILVRRRGNGTFVNRVYLDITINQKKDAATRIRTTQNKFKLRQKVWAELRQVARPDSRFHWNFEEFVPDFEGSEQCASAIRNMACYQNSRVIFIAPDNSLTLLRQCSIEDRKTLIVATHGIVRGFMVIEPGQVPPGNEQLAATLDGMEYFARPISLEEIKALAAIDLLVTGVSLVTKHGVRWGKGHGYFDLEWAMFRELGLVDEDTPVIAVGHDCQMVSTDVEPAVFDTLADIIVTPTQVIEVVRSHRKPEHILWDYLSPELYEQVPTLQTLFERIHPE